MASKHLGRAITEEQRRRWVSLLMGSAGEAGLPTDPEFRAVFAYYIEWGTRMALIYSGPNPPAVDAAPMPHWSWGQDPAMAARLRGIVVEWSTIAFPLCT